jgi:hypothetical protein
MKTERKSNSREPPYVREPGPEMTRKIGDGDDENIASSCISGCSRRILVSIKVAMAIEHRHLYSREPANSRRRFISEQLADFIHASLDHLRLCRKT